MAFREVDVIEVREVLRGWLDGGGLRTVAERAGWTASPPAGMSRRRRRPACAAGLGRRRCATS